jgi:hypothetical protein
MFRVTQPLRKSGSGCIDKIMGNSSVSPTKTHVLLLGRPYEINVVNRVAFGRVSAKQSRSHVSYDSTNVPHLVILVDTIFTLTG